MKFQGLKRLMAQGLHPFRWAKALAWPLAGLAFLTCNVEPDQEHRINLYLNDSLSQDKGKYDSLQISFAGEDGEIFQENVFRGPFRIDSTQGVLKGLFLGPTSPTNYSIVIVAFQKGDSAVYSISVVNGETQDLVVKIPLPPGEVVIVNPPPIETTDPKELVLSDSALTLGYNETFTTTFRIYATLKPAGSVGTVQFSSEDSLVAVVDESGLARSTGVGNTAIRACVANLPEVCDTTKIRVIAPTAITSVRLERPIPTFYVGGPTLPLVVKHEPMELEAFLDFSSSDTGVLVHQGSGKFKAIRFGEAIVTVKAIGSKDVKDTVHVTTQVDAPSIDAGPSRSVAVGQEVAIPVKVTQQFGSLQLSWDFDGDPIPDSTVTTQGETLSVTARHVYREEGDFSAVFTARDGEGNVSGKTVRVRVGKAGPLITIHSPKPDTLVNTPEITIRYSSDEVSKQVLATLREGVNTVTVRDSNATGKDSASIRIRLDTKPPVVKILSPANGWETRMPVVDVVWSVDSVVQQTQNKEDLAGKQGSVPIAREVRDSAGNIGSAAVTILYDTVPPLAPVFQMSDSLFNAPRPEWAWKSGGGNGAGVYSVQLDSQQAVIVSKMTYSPSVDLKDGRHTLRVSEQDVAGNVSAKAIKTIEIKTTRPFAPTFVDSSTTPSPSNNKRPRWTWKSSGAAGGGIGRFKWTINTPTPVQKEDNSTSFSTPADLQDGAYTLSVEERDAFGNWSLPVSRTIQIKTVGSKVKILSPVAGTYTKIKSGVVDVVWQIDDVNQDSLKTETLLKEGQWNVIRRQVRDAAANVTFDTVSVFWDTTAPKILFSSPVHGAMVNQSQIKVAWSADGATQNTQTSENLGSVEGSKTIARSFTDKAGNTGIGTINVTLDFMMPTQTRLAKILVLDKSQVGANGHSESRRDLNAALQEGAAKWGFSVTTLTQTDPASRFAEEFSAAALAQYQAVLFSNNDGVDAQLDSVSKVNVENYVKNGGTLVAIHAASAFVAKWSWYTQSLAQVFLVAGTNQPRANLTHDAEGLAAGTAASGIFKNLVAPTAFMDEFYSFRGSPRDTVGVTVLVTVDESTFDKTINSPMGADHPVVWTRKIEKGNVVHFSLGHSWSTNNVYAASNGYLQKLLYRIMRFGAGDFVGCTDATKAKYNPDATESDPAQCQ
jgi:type 1 glutamine amidotransferase